MPTLLSINNYYYRRGGAETVFLEQNRLLEQAGWSVVPFSMTHPQNLESAWSGYFVDEIEFGRQYSALQNLGRAGKVVYSFEARRKLDRLLNAVVPDVCHAHNIYHHLSPSILGLLGSRGVPTVMTLHDLKIACPAYNMLTHDGICERCRGGRLDNVIRHRCIKGSRALSSLVALEAVLHRAIGSYRRFVDRFLVPSRFYVDKLAHWGVAREHMTYVPNFVDATRYAPRFEPGRGFVFFGRVAKEKGVGTLLRAASTAGVDVTIVGTGPEVESMRTLATSIGANAHFTGYLAGEGLQEVVRTSRAVVLPSEWYENAPMSLLEAYALGKPMIGADIGGIPELIRPAETGARFASGDAGDLARVLREMADAPDAEIERMGRNGREWVEREFSAEVYLRRVLAVYRELGVDTASRISVPS
jgi:glycosyltransferase involved in cell wall biosynthesis